MVFCLYLPFSVHTHCPLMGSTSIENHCRNHQSEPSTNHKRKSSHPRTYPMRENADMVIHQVIDREDFSIHSTLKGKDQVPYQMAPIIREAVHITESRRKAVR